MEDVRHMGENLVERNYARLKFEKYLFDFICATTGLTPLQFQNWLNTGVSYPDVGERLYNAMGGRLPAPPAAAPQTAHDRWAAAYRARAGSQEIGGLP